MIKPWRVRTLIALLTKRSGNPGEERYRRALLTAVMNVISQFISIITGLVSVPLALAYVGPERFSIWITLSTALAFITFSDFGVGIGAQDRMSRCLGQGDRNGARRAFYSTLLFSIILFVVVMVVGGLLLANADLASIFSIKSKEAIDELFPAAMMVALCFALGLVSGVVQRAFNAFQEGFWVALIQALARVFSLVMLFVVVHLKMGLPALIFVVGGLSSVAVLFAGLAVLVSRHDSMTFHGLSDSLSWVDLKEIFRVGSFGLGAAVAIYLVNNSALVVMAQKYGAEGVADYAVLLKLVGIPSLLLTYLVLPLWPAIAEARAKGDNSWIVQAYKKCVYLVIALAFGSLAVLLLFGQDVIRLWTGNSQVVPDFGLLLAASAFMVIGFWNALVSTMLNGLSKFRGQATYGLALAVSFVGLAIMIPSDLPKEAVVWVIGFGFLIRCALMQIEVRNALRMNVWR